MLVNINLLPQREKKKGSSLVLIAISLLLLLVGGGWLLLQYQSLQVKLSTAQQQLNTAQKLREIEEGKGSQQVSASSVEQLESIVQWAEQKQVPTVLILHHLIAALPDRGLFLNYQYSGDGIVNLTVQFDTVPEVSGYLHRLQEDQVIEEAKLTNIITVPMVAIKEEQDSYIPRHQAQFQLKLNIAKLKEEKGGTK